MTNRPRLPFALAMGLLVLFAALSAVAWRISERHVARGKQLETMRRIRALYGCFESYAVGNCGYPRVRKSEDILAICAEYKESGAGSIEATDAWGHDLLFQANCKDSGYCACDSYLIASAGADGVFERTTWSARHPTVFERSTRLTRHPTFSPSDDLIWGRLHTGTGQEQYGWFRWSPEGGSRPPIR